MTGDLHPFLARLAQAGEWEPPTPPVRERNGSPRVSATPGPGDPQASRYAGMALEREAHVVASTPEGGRNHALNVGAFRMGQLVARGWLADQTTCDVLVDAGVASGLSYAESERTVHSGLDAGKRTPRDDVDLYKSTPDAYVMNGSALGGAESPSISNDVGSHEENEEHDADHTPPRQLVDGGQFIYGALPHVPAVWGDGDDVLWAMGEPAILTGPTGVGKTTLGTSLIAGRLGLLPDALGYPITPGRKRTLVLAMDRPAQIQRAMARLLRQYPEEVLSERLVVWKGPPPMDLGRHPHLLYQLAQLADADTVVIDSLKDAAVRLSEEEAGQGLSRAMNICVSNDVEILAYHHQKKNSSRGDGKPNTIADVYGSHWITAGAGSVLLLWGSPGDLVVELSHLKQPAAEVGPLSIGHDHTAGRSFLYDGISEDDKLLDLLSSGPQSAATVASWLYGGADDRAAVARAHRRLDQLVAAGKVTRVDGPTPAGRTVGGRLAGRQPARYAVRTAGRTDARNRSTPKTQSILELDVSPGRTVNMPHPVVDLDTENTSPNHAEDTPTVNPQVTPKTHRRTPANPATESTPPPPFRGGGVRARASAPTREGDPIPLEEEVCARCLRDADRLVAGPHGRRWCLDCVRSTERHDTEE
jgi:hypothetical protein